MKAIKQKLFDNPATMLDNIVLPTGEAAPKSRICFLFESASKEAGHGMAPNVPANQVIFDVFGWQEHTFHGNVAMFYIDEAGSKISQQILDLKALEAAVQSMKKAIHNGGRMTHAPTFWDNETTEEAEGEGSVDVEVAEPES